MTEGLSVVNNTKISMSGPNKCYLKARQYQVSVVMVDELFTENQHERGRESNFATLHPHPHKVQEETFSRIL